MTWTRAAAYWLCFLALAAYYVWSAEPTEPTVEARRRAPFPEDGAAAVQALRVERGAHVVRCERTGERWQATEPPGAAVASDLVGSLLAALTEAPDVEVVGDAAGRLREFGLDPPATTITLERDGQPALVVGLGVSNPADTAIYARRGDSEQVFLVGMNVRYYADLLHAAAFPED